MQIETLKVEPRSTQGTRAVQRLRKSGVVPGIVYGHGQSPEAVQVDRHSLELLLHKNAHVLQLDRGGRTESCLLKDVQWDHLGIAPMHVDFTRIDLSEKVKVKVRVELRGTAKGQSEGGQIVQQLMDMEVECTAASIPDSIRVNIADLALHQLLHVREIAMPEGVRAVTDGEAIVVACREAIEHLEVAPAAAAEGSAEPEVIAKGKIEKEGEEAAEKK